ncbi:MAG: carbon-nitrogen hydrolase family protein [Gammaproteobacteria bacterium]|nr:carbon-nitrogen hydrolase family protein [Gammaproteobacteria bacterium]
MKVTVCQLDNRAAGLKPMLAELAEHIAREGSEFLLLPEMCFAEWLAADATPARNRWLAAVKSHAEHILELGKLGVPALISTRPTVNDGGSFRNQAYLWTTQPRIVPIHEKYYLPDEEGYWEASWYERGDPEFDYCEALGIRIGVQICTEMWFFEWARQFARDKTELLCIPRATPHGSLTRWLAGGQAAAVCAGAYCLSSNLWTPPGSKADCGGLGWIISPEGDVLAQTSEESPFATVEVDLEFSRQSKSSYPRYVAE